MNRPKSYFVILIVLFLSLGLVTAVLAATDYGRNPAMPIPEPDIQPVIHQQGENLISEMPRNMQKRRSQAIYSTEIR